jgi:hypothetical protein
VRGEEQKVKRTTKSLRLPLAALIALLTTSCGGGVDAGRNGGVAFVILTVFLLIGCVVLYIALGRED